MDGSESLRPLLAAADYGLMALHLLVILFALTGWCFRRLRRAHLALMLAIAFSWLALGAFYGWGYCFLTDWAWELKRIRGETGLPPSFVEYTLERATGRDWASSLVEWATGIAGASALMLSIFVNTRR